MSILGYARDVAGGPTLDAQAKVLKAAGAVSVFHEGAAGAKVRGFELGRALSALKAGDILLVTRLDRLAQSTRDLLGVLDAITSAGAGFRSLGDRWADTTTTRGRELCKVLAGLREFERDLIRARTGEGRARARRRGVPMGRPPKLDARQKQEALRSLADGSVTQADLARRFHLSQSTISRLAAKAAPRSWSSPTRLPLDAATERAARLFMQRLEGRYAVREGLLFGSRARGDHRADSDADLAVILEGESGDRYSVSSDMSGLAFDVMMETGILVDPLPLWEGEFKRAELFSNPALIEAVKREGRRL
jgi:DNA invertase Pin-like site-specific DNA recombinase/predicted nucleotidyltransferase